MPLKSQNATSTRAKFTHTATGATLTPQKEALRKIARLGAFGPMARDFSKVSPLVWKSRKFLSLPDNDARLFYLFVLTGPHQTNAGISKLPLAYASHDLKWSLEQVQKSMEACVHAGLLEHENETDEVMVTNWFAFNVPTNIKHRMGVVKTIERVESERFYESAMNQLEDVYFDANCNKPNPRPEVEQQQLDHATGEIITLPPTSPKRPSDFTRGEMDALCRNRRIGG